MLGVIIMKKILLHICCGPCAITCVEALRDEGFAVTGLFYNPNIHPGQEYLRRREGALQVAQRMDFPLLFAGGDDLFEEYRPEDFFRAVALKEEARCRECYRLRLDGLGRFARENGFDLVTTSLLYSRYQQHDLIRALGEEFCAPMPGEAPGCAGGGPCFYYCDFRTGWSRGITLSKKWNIYRQQYCGCIFSEAERYLKSSGDRAEPGAATNDLAGAD